MPDPWVEGEALEEHEQAVQEHYLTAQAEALREEERELAKTLANERIEAEFGPDKGEEPTPEEEALQSRPAAEGANAEAVTGGQGTSGEQTAPEPAGNADSAEPTQKSSRAKKS